MQLAHCQLKEEPDETALRLFRVLSFGMSHCIVWYIGISVLHEPSASVFSSRLGTHTEDGDNSFLRHSSCLCIIVCFIAARWKPWSTLHTADEWFWIMTMCRVSWLELPSYSLIKSRMRVLTSSSEGKDKILVTRGCLNFELLAKRQNELCDK